MPERSHPVFGERFSNRVVGLCLAASACDDAQLFFLELGFLGGQRSIPLCGTSLSSESQAFPLPGADTFLSAPPGKAGRRGRRGGTRPSLAHCAVQPLKASASLLGTAFSHLVQSPSSFTFYLSCPPHFCFDSSLWFDQILS